MISKGGDRVGVPLAIPDGDIAAGPVGLVDDLVSGSDVCLHHAPATSNSICGAGPHLLGVDPDHDQ